MSIVWNWEYKQVKGKPEIICVGDYKTHTGQPSIRRSDSMLKAIGKSINIRDRVKSHFSRDYLSPRDLNISRQIKSIEFHKTAGELGALFLESLLIKKLQPVYNRKLRLSRKLIAVKKTEIEK